MNSKQARTLAAIFAVPTSSAIEWAAIEGLLLAAGCQMIEGNGSRVRIVLWGVVASFHRPHPAKEAKQYQVRDAREFLVKLGVKP
jgi:HicA toxin of bacterial toxin-antitoxin,